MRARSGCRLQGLEGAGKAMAGSGEEDNPALASSAELSWILHRLLCPDHPRVLEKITERGKQRTHERTACCQCPSLQQR